VLLAQIHRDLIRALPWYPPAEFVRSLLTGADAAVVNALAGEFSVQQEANQIKLLYTPTTMPGDLNSDGIHPNGNGSEKVADLLLDFLRDEPTATWLFGEPVTATEAPEPATVTTTTLAGDPGLSEATLPVPDTTGRPGSDNQGETSGTGSPGDQGSLTGDTTRRERREQERAEREQERQEQGSGQQAPGATGAPDDDDPDSVAAGPADIEDVPPLVWALAGAGAMMLLFLVVRFIRDKTRPKEEDPPAA